MKAPSPQAGAYRKPMPGPVEWRQKPWDEKLAEALGSFFGNLAAGASFALGVLLMFWLFVS